ncbi:MAG: hypothetical protein WA951_07570 [Leeuwenhoekiella sp.]
MRKILFLILAFYALDSNSQSNPPIPETYDMMSTLDKVSQVPKSPEVAAFGRYGGIPVNLYTGSPNISIPVYTIEGVEMSLPVSLSYDASGVKLDQIATNVGLGWNLNFGGVVSRNVNHMPDDIDEGGNFEPIWGYLMQHFQNYVMDNDVWAFGQEHPSGMVNEIKERYEDFQTNTADTQADTFSFNVNGLSGNIVINYIDDGQGGDTIQAYCVEHPDLKVEAGPAKSGNSALSPITYWSITNTDGTRYIFEDAEVTWTQFAADDYFGRGEYYQYIREYNSAWYLSKMISPNGLDVFEMSYSNLREWDVPVERREKKAVYLARDFNCGFQFAQPALTTPPVTNDYKMKQFHLETITWNGNIILTTETATRDDLPGMKRVKKIRIDDENGNNIRMCK